MRKLAIILAIAYALCFLLAAYDAYGQVTESIAPVQKIPMPCSRYVDEIEKYPWDTVMVAKIMYAESKCNPKAVNKRDSHRRCNGSYGLMQLACIHKGGDKLDPKENIRMAYAVYKKAGNSFRPWTTYAKLR